MFYEIRIPQLRVTAVTGFIISFSLKKVSINPDLERFAKTLSRPYQGLLVLQQNKLFTSETKRFE
jgi:hypothetical protein